MEKEITKIFTTLEELADYIRYFNNTVLFNLEVVKTRNGTLGIQITCLEKDYENAKKEYQADVDLP